MRFGVCATPDKAEMIAAAGYDYIELAAASVLAPLDEDAVWLPMQRTIDAMPLRPEAFNVFITAAKVAGPEAEAALLERYVHTLMRRAALVGGKGCGIWKRWGAAGS